MAASAPKPKINTEEVNKQILEYLEARRKLLDFDAEYISPLPQLKELLRKLDTA